MSLSITHPIGTHIVYLEDACLGVYKDNIINNNNNNNNNVATTGGIGPASNGCDRAGHNSNSMLVKSVTRYLQYAKLLPRSDVQPLVYKHVNLCIPFPSGTTYTDPGSAGWFGKKTNIVLSSKVG